MAYVTNIDDEQKNQSGGPIAPGGAGNTVQLSPNGGVGSAGGSSASTGQPQSGGQFASLNQYVNANQGQAAPLANQITNSVNQQYNNLAGQNQQTLQGIQGQVDQGYTKQNQDILAQEAANPVSFASDKNNVQSFQGQLNDKYTGPQSAESTGDYSNQLANVNNAISQGQAQVGSDAGRQQLLKQHEAAPTAGVTGLNSAILAQDPNAQKNIEQAYQPFSNLVTGLQSGAQDINSQIGQAQTEAQNASQAANQQIAGQIGSLNKSVNDTATQDQAAQAVYNNQLSAYQNKWNPLSTDINSFNEVMKANPLIGNGTQFTNPFAPTLQQNAMNNIYTPQNVASADQYAQAGAFNSLLNGLNTGIGAPILTQDMANQAGTVQAPTAFNGAVPNMNDIGTGLGGLWKTDVQGNPQFSNQYSQVKPVWENLFNELNKQYGQTPGKGNPFG